MALATFSLGGFYAALVPGVLTEKLHNANIAVARRPTHDLSRTAA
jgi:hypothetical protein